MIQCLKPQTSLFVCLFLGVLSSGTHQDVLFWAVWSYSSHLQVRRIHAGWEFLSSSQTNKLWSHVLPLSRNLLLLLSPACVNSSETFSLHHWKAEGNTKGLKRLWWPKLRAEGLITQNNLWRSSQTRGTLWLLGYYSTYFPLEWNVAAAPEAGGGRGVAVFSQSERIFVCVAALRDPVCGEGGRQRTKRSGGGSRTTSGPLIWAHQHQESK